MNYVWHKENEEVDRWVADLDEATMEKSIGEAAKSLKKRQEQQALNDSKDNEYELKDKNILIKELIQYLDPNETALKAMRRIGNKNKTQNKKKLQNSSSETSKIINKITELCDVLLSRGELTIYDTSREILELLSIEWEYTGLDGKIHGPFTSKEMFGWIQQGFFTGSSSVLMREYQKPTKLSTNSIKRNSETELENDFDDSDDPDVETKEEKHSSNISSSSTSLNSNSNSQFSNWIKSDEIDFSPLLEISTDTPFFPGQDKLQLGTNNKEKETINYNNGDDGDDDEGDEGEAEGFRKRKRRKAEENDSDED